jgi:hypothetical protein
LQFLRARGLVDRTLAEKAPWGDESVDAAIESAAHWVHGLANVMSLSGQWKFHLAPKPDEVPQNFEETGYDDTKWASLPGVSQGFFTQYKLCTIYWKMGNRRAFCVFIAKIKCRTGFLVDSA